MKRTREEIIEDIKYHTKWAKYYAKLAEDNFKVAEHQTKWAEGAKQRLKEFDELKEKGDEKN